MFTSQTKRISTVTLEPTFRLVLAVFAMLSVMGWGCTGTGDISSDGSCAAECVHGTCEAGTCVCDDGYTGEQCSERVPHSQDADGAEMSEPVDITGLRYFSDGTEYDTGHVFGDYTRVEGSNQEMSLELIDDERALQLNNLREEPFYFRNIHLPEIEAGRRLQIYAKVRFDPDAASIPHLALQWANPAQGRQAAALSAHDGSYRYTGWKQGEWFEHPDGAQEVDFLDENVLEFVHEIDGTTVRQKGWVDGQQEPDFVTYTDGDLEGFVPGVIAFGGTDTGTYRILAWGLGIDTEAPRDASGVSAPQTPPVIEDVAPTSTSATIEFTSAVPARWNEYRLRKDGEEWGAWTPKWDLDELRISGLVPETSYDVEFRSANMGGTSSAALTEFLTTSSPVMPGTWRSNLYPADWQPGYTNERGDFLHDYSHAGYHSGERPIPSDPPGVVLDVTQSPYDADSSGATDSNRAIQRAIDDAGAAGGGVVYLPAGEYRIAPPTDASEALWIDRSGVVLRGDGPEQTFVFNDSYQMRYKTIIRVEPRDGGSWNDGSATRMLASDAPNGALDVTLESTDGLNVGDWVVLGSDITEGFAADIDGRHVDTWVGRVQGLRFLRKLQEVDRASNIVTLDIPLRYGLKTRDAARIFKPDDPLEEIGIESLSLGGREHPGEGFGQSDYRVEGTAAYEVHRSHVVFMQHVVNGWMRNVTSYKPSTNGNRHFVSNGIELVESRGITLSDVFLEGAQYRGGGGNGYGFTLRANECLLARTGGTTLRLVYSFKRLHASGNVIFDSSAGSIRSDFHMHFSPSNLIDNLSVSRYFNAPSRGATGSIPHAVTLQDAVFWNMRGVGDGRESSVTSASQILNVSGQADRVFVIGTRGERVDVKGMDPDHAHRFEGIGEGDTLVPESLYRDQVMRRLGVCHTCDD